jgi:hypothetical protein
MICCLQELFTVHPRSVYGAVGTFVLEMVIVRFIYVKIIF